MPTLRPVRFLVNQSNGSSLVRHAAEAWHPKHRHDPKHLRRLKLTETRFKTVIQDHMTAQLAACVTAFSQVAIPAPVARKAADPDPEDISPSVYAAVSQYMTLVEAELAKTSEPFSIAVAQAYASALQLGANAALVDLPGIDTMWSVLDPAATTWMREQSLSLVKGLNTTTTNRLQSTMTNGLILGESRNQIADRIKSVMDDIPEWRARLIAQTEIIRAYSEGAVQRYESSDVVTGKRWVDGQPKACPVCKSGLNGKIVGLRDMFKSRYGPLNGPPAHPGCRCTLAPVLVVPD